jgi:peptidyl-prolyl cis-trans isomerase SurA
MKKIILYISLILVLFTKVLAQSTNEIKIISKIDNEIITNIDVINEMNYLIAINNELKSIKDKELQVYALTSLQKEIIKKKELLKYYELNQKNDYLESYIKNFYQRLQIGSQQEFELYLAEYNLKFEDIRRKLEIEVVWNELIFSKYKDQVNIDVEKIKNKIRKKKIEVSSYQLSEILFQIKNKEELDIQYNKIINSITEKGFVNTASIYSVSDSAKYGGEIGWINERQLSQNINDNINQLEVGELSKPIIVPGGILLLKVNDKKKENINYNEDEELKKTISYEKNKQFNQFSLIYFNKIKINSKIDEK